MTDPPYGVEYDPAWRHRAGRQPSKRTRQGQQRRPGRLGRGLGAVPRQRSPMSGTAPCTPRTVAESLDRTGLHHPRPDHLGQGAPGHRPRRLPLAARALLVRRPQEGQLDRRPQADDALDDRQPRTRTPRPSHGTQKPVECMRRPIAQQHQPRPGGLRAVPGQRHDADRRRDLRPRLPRRSRSIRSTSMSPSAAGRPSPGRQRPSAPTDGRSTRWRRHAADTAELEAAPLAVSQREERRLTCAAASPSRRGSRCSPAIPGKRPLNRYEPRPEPAIPECPPELSAARAAEWDRLVGELGSCALLTNLDRAALAAYCGAYALWAEAIEAIQKYGVMVKSPTGYPDPVALRRRSPTARPRS